MGLAKPKNLIHLERSYLAFSKFEIEELKEKILTWLSSFFITLKLAHYCRKSKSENTQVFMETDHIWSCIKIKNCTRNFLAIQTENNNIFKKVNRMRLHKGFEQSMARAYQSHIWPSNRRNDKFATAWKIKPLGINKIFQSDLILLRKVI